MAPSIESTAESKPTTGTGAKPGNTSNNSDVLAAQFALSIKQRQKMVASWLGGGDSDESDEDTAADPSANAAESPVSGFNVLPSSSVGLGSKRSKLDRQSVQVALNRSQYYKPPGGATETPVNLKALANSAKALHSLKNKADRVKMQQQATARGGAAGAGPAKLGRGGGSGSDDDDEEEESRSKTTKRASTNKSFFDSYRGQKKRKTK